MAINTHTRYAIPMNIGICITDKCNLRCTYCMRETFKPRGELQKQTIERILNENPYLTGVCIMGLCEPLLHPDLVNIIKLLHSKKMSISLTTNGTIPITNELYTELKKVGLFCISIDTTDKKTFRELRAGADLDSVWNNLISVIQYKRDEGLSNTDNPKLQVNAVITKKNIGQIERLIQDLKEYKEDLYYLSFEGVSRTDYSKEDPFIISQEDYEGIYKRHKISAKESGIRIVGLDYISYESTEWGNCSLAKLGPFIHPNGDVYFCFDYQNTIGNIFQEPLLKIWNNTKAKEFRRHLNSNKPPLEQCKYCSFARANWQLGGKYLDEPKDVSY